MGSDSKRCKRLEQIFARCTAQGRKRWVRERASKVVNPNKNVFSLFHLDCISTDLKVDATFVLLLEDNVWGTFVQPKQEFIFILIFWITLVFSRKFLKENETDAK
jgi:hypothetical protein